MSKRDPFLDCRTCRGCGCTDARACLGGCAWYLLDVGTPSGVCSVCAVQLQLHPVLLDTVGTDAMDDVGQSIFAHLACARDWPPRPQLVAA